MALTNNEPLATFTLANAEHGLMDAARFSYSGLLKKGEQTVSSAMADWLVSLTSADIAPGLATSGYCLMLQGLQSHYLFIGMDLNSGSTQKRLCIVPSSSLSKSLFCGVQSLKKGFTLEGTPWANSFTTAGILPAMCQVPQSTQFGLEHAAKSLSLSTSIDRFLELITKSHWSRFYTPLIFTQGTNLVVGPSFSTLMAHSVKHCISIFCEDTDPTSEEYGQALGKLEREIEALLDYLFNHFDSLSEKRKTLIQSSKWFEVFKDAVGFYNENIRPPNIERLSEEKLIYCGLVDQRSEELLFPEAIAYVGAHLMDRSAALIANTKANIVYHLTTNANKKMGDMLTAFDERSHVVHESARLDGSPYLTTFYSNETDTWLSLVSEMTEIAGPIFQGSRTAIAKGFSPRALAELYTLDFDDALTELEELVTFSRKV